MSRKITKSSGNVFKDLGFDNPDEYKTKANLALEIIKIINQRDLTQKEAAALIHTTQPDISKLKKGHLNGFTIDRLCSFLRHLNRNIEIRVTKSRSKMGKMEIVAA